MMIKPFPHFLTFSFVGKPYEVHNLYKHLVSALRTQLTSGSTPPLSHFVSAVYGDWLYSYRIFLFCFCILCCLYISSLLLSFFYFTLSKLWMYLFDSPFLNLTTAFKNVLSWAFLVAQWLRICLPMQGTWVRALVWEDPTCHGATGPVSHNYRACASGACASGACAPQQERPR